MSALEAIDCRILDLEAEKRVIDAKIEELEKLRGELGSDSPDEEETDETPAAPPPVRRRALPPAPASAPTNGHARPKADGGERSRRSADEVRALLARALAGGPVSLGVLCERAEVAQSVASRWLRQLGPDAPTREQCFRKGDDGWELTAHGRATLLKE